MCALAPPVAQVNNNEEEDASAVDLVATAKAGPFSDARAARGNVVAEDLAAWLRSMQRHATHLRDANVQALQRRLTQQQAPSNSTRQPAASISPSPSPEQGPALSYPAARRVVVAALMRAWLLTAGGHEHAHERAPLRGGLGSAGSSAKAMPMRQAGASQRKRPRQLTQHAASHVWAKATAAQAHGSEAEGGSRGAAGRGAAAPAWDLSVERGALALLHTLFEVHVSGMAARGVMEFVHVSKAGGTSTCLAAGEHMAHACMQMRQMLHADDVGAAACR